MKSYKYDKTEQKIFFIAGCILSAAFVIALVVAALEDRSGNVDTAGVIATLVLFFTPLPALACWYSYIDSRMYFKRLAKYGIEAPLHKKDVQPIADENVQMADVPEEKYSRERAILIL